MNPMLEGQRRYLVALRDACAANPTAHSHQLPALDREIALAAVARDAAEYRAASSDLFELTRAVWLDRTANHARVHMAVGDYAGARAHVLEYSLTVAAKSQPDWISRFDAAGAEVAGLRGINLEVASRFTNLLVCLIRMRGEERQYVKPLYVTEACEAYRALLASDGGFTWSSVDSKPTYRLRLPWSTTSVLASWVEESGMSAEPGPVLADVGDLLAEISAGEALWSGGLSASASGVAALNQPSAEDGIAPYRAIAETVTGEDRVSTALRRAAEEIIVAGSSAPTPQGALARLVEAGLLTRFAAAPLKARAEEAIDRQRLWPDPLVEHHWRTVVQHLDRARTPTEVDLIAAYTDSCFVVEAGWNVALLASLLAPLRAAFAYGCAPSEDARRGLEQAAATSYTLLGLGPRELLRLPRVTDFLGHIVVPLAPRDLEGFGVFHGEAGADLLLEVRGWNDAMAAQGRSERLDSSRAGEVILAFFNAARVREPAPAPRPVQLWTERIPLNELVPALSRPVRPAVAGMAGL